MKKIVRNFRHEAGFHCASTALADVMRYHGHNLSEAMCFGLGAGLGFAYLEETGRSPSRFFSTRAPELEAAFFRHLLGDFQWREGDAFPWAEMQAYLDADIPILLLTDLYYLPHYGKSVHFPGHGVVLCGYQTGDDGQAAIAYLADTNFPDLQPVPLPDLAAAMHVPLPPIPVRNNWHPVHPFSLPDLTAPLRRAIRANARAMLQPPHPNMGVAGMARLAETLPAWANAPDWQWCARFAYQVIERRGTGGGAFRKMYARFLRESLAWLPALARPNAPVRMETIAQKWTTLSDWFKMLSEQQTPTGFHEAASQLRELASLEKSLFADILIACEG